MYEELCEEDFLNSIKQLPKTYQKPNIEKSNKYDSYFENTQRLSDVESKYIKNLLINNKIIGRKFYDNKNEIKYLEIFKNDILKFLGISSNVTFIYLYEPNEENLYRKDNFIGFRYYKSDPFTSGSNYFTLINRYDNKYFILEKNKSIKDINGEIFFNNELNCFSIINEIIIDKYKNKSEISNGETFPEILGYCYGLISLNKIKNFKFIEPLIPEAFKEDSFKEDIPEKLETNITYVEPIIYDRHISLIIFSEINAKRYNLILDMSKYHSNQLYVNSLIYPKNILERPMQYPNNPIQNYSSCCMWFYGEIECILNNNNKYSCFKSIFDNIKGNSIYFYIDVINSIETIFFGNNNLFQMEKRRSLETETLDMNRLFLDGYKNNFSVHKSIIYSKFLDIKGFIDVSSFYYFPDYKILIDYQKEIIKYFEYKNLLRLNYKFYGIVAQNKNMQDFLNNILDLIQLIDNILEKIDNVYDIEFYKNNVISYKTLMISDILKGKELFFPEYKKIKEVDKYEMNSFFENLSSTFNKEKKKLEKTYNISSEDTILKHMNPKNEICYKLMNK